MIFNDDVNVELFFNAVNPLTFHADANDDLFNVVNPKSKLKKSIWKG